MTTTQNSIPPLVWPSAGELAGHAENRSTALLDHMPAKFAQVLGIISALDHRGVDLVEKLLRGESAIEAKVILAVYGGCPTRSGDLARLLELQTQTTRRVEFRILPMMFDSVGMPVNCLVATPTDATDRFFLFGPTPDLGIDGADQTQVNLVFKAEATLFDQWRRWFDFTWLRSAELTEATADIPALVPAVGSLEATAQWDAYRTLCSDSAKSEDAIAIDQDTGEVKNGKKADGSEDPTPTVTMKLPKLDRLTGRMDRLFAAGKQVTIAHSSAARPLDAPVNPRVFGQETEQRDGTVVHRQSFRISIFTQAELKKIEDYRKGSQTILKKLGLPLATGIYWMPDKVVPIFNDEIAKKEEEARTELIKLVGGNAGTYLKGKMKKIEEDLTAFYQRLGGTGDLPEHALTEMLEDLTSRIQHALDSHMVTPVTLSAVRFEPPTEMGGQAPWAQAEKLVLALARFPRQAIYRPKTLSGLKRPRSEILSAMGVENDAILEVQRENRSRSQSRARSELQMLDGIENADIMGRDRCEAGFMLIDGKSRDQIQQFIASRESATRSGSSG